jgi:hypothetical protein
MPAQQISGTVTRKANGVIEFTPADPGAFNKLPAMGDEVTLTVDVMRTAAEVEKATAHAKKERLAPVAEAAPAKKK